MVNVVKKALVRVGFPAWSGHLLVLREASCGG